MKAVYPIGLLLLLLHPCHLIAQDSARKEHPLTLNGYIKNLQTFTFSKDFKDIITGNLLHNRINLKWKPRGAVTAAVELRNRLFWGEELKATPGFKDRLRNENEVLDLSKSWINSKDLLLHTNIERLWIEYRKQKWNVRLGRQRINWGIATIWNPNDMFNTYNFLDFDYEERSGNDALKAQYLLNDFSNLEIAANLSFKKNKTAIAAKYFLNKWGYDMQWLAGAYQGKITTGIGWAGNIGNASFKGEGQLFINGKDSGSSFNGTMESGYVFTNGWYLSEAFLYCSEGLAGTVNDWSKIDFSPSPVKLMPTRWNIVLTGSKELTPLLSVRTSLVYSPGVNLFILLPSFSYSLADNFTADLVWQSFFASLDNHFEAVNHLCFLRIKWNF
ncbi:MAG: hypothetical protein Q8941_02085 [Bacteroidota bacterium]|nr:hypothetical protein [Bacteroidota bacterium]